MRVNRFARTNRIRQSGDFKVIFQNGFKVITPTLIFRVIACEHAEPRIGLAVSRKVGNAVKRNIVRRRIKEAFRLKKSAFVRSFDIVVSPRQGVLEKDFDDYLAAFDMLLSKTNRINTPSLRQA